MKKYWKSIAAIVLVVAVVATVALSTIDFRLRATDSDGNIGSGEVVEQQIEVTQPETEAPVETQPETAAPETTTTTVYNTNSEIQETTTAVEIKTEQEANAETTSAAATEAATTPAETTAAATTVASHTETTAAETTSETTTQPASEEATSETETTTEEQTTTAAPDRSVRLRTNLDDGTTPYEGMTVVLTVELNGFEDCEYTIQWQRSTDNVNWEDVPGATDQSYSFTLTEETNGYYWNAQVTVKE